MAAPSYTTDLQIFNNCTVLTNIADPTGFTGLNRGGTIDTDLAIYGDRCISDAQRNAGKGGLVYEQTEPAGFVDGTDCYFVWFKWFAPNALVSKAAGGIQVFVGNSASNFSQYYVDGNDTYAYGGWQNYVVNPNTTAATRSAVTGSPNGTHSTVGVAIDITIGISKGNGFTMDIFRWGRGELIIEHGDVANGYAIFSGIAVPNDNQNTGRWGLFQDVGGSYLWKGLMSLGNATNAVDFRDSNVVIVIQNTEYVQAAFNRIAVTNTASNVEWTAVNITSLSTVSRGEFEMIDGATLTFDNCVFTDMSTFIFNKGTGACTLTTVTFRRCNTVTQGGATITDSIFETSNAAISMIVDNLSLVTGNRFISDGTGHAVNLGNITTTQTLTWNNTLVSSVSEWTGVTGDPITTGTTGNEAILCNVSAGQKLTISVADGATIPTVKNDGTGTVQVQSGQKLLTINVSPLPTPDYEYRLYTVTATGSMAGAVELDGAENSTTAQQTYTHGYTSQAIAIQIISNVYKEVIRYETLVNTQNQTVNIDLEVDRDD